MAGGGAVGGKEDSGREPQLYILALPTAALPAVVISHLDASVPRKARTCLPRAVPLAWWSGRISFLPPPPAEDLVKGEEGRRLPRPQRVRVAPSLDLGTAAAGGEKPQGAPALHREKPRPQRVQVAPSLDLGTAAAGGEKPRPQRVRVAPSLDLRTAAAGGKKPAKRLRKCLHCGKKEMGRGTLCNACGVGKIGALPERRPAASPIVDSPLENPIWEPEVPGAIYLVRKSAAERRPPRTEAAPAPRPGTRCLHCGSSELPLWIEGPTGRREVCAACGMRYKKGRLLPECPSAAKPVTDSLLHSPSTNSPPESPIWEPEAAQSVHLSKRISKKKRKRKAGPAAWAKDKGKACLHCGTLQTPQWREGPKGRGTLCNACGVRYKQGGLLPEYRPVASPTFLPSKHANLRRKVLQLHRNRQDLSPPVPVNSVTNMPPIHGDRPIDMAGHADEDLADAPGCTDKPINVPSSLDSLAGHADEDLADAPGCTDKPINVPSSLDSLLLDGPSAPLIVESEEFLIS